MRQYSRDYLSLNLEQPPLAAFRSRHFHGNSPTTCRAHCPPRSSASARRPGHVVSLAQAALAARHHSHRRISAGASALELRGAERPGSLRRAGEVPQQPAAGARAGVGLHLPAHPLSRWLRRLYLAARQIERCVLPVGRELDVPGAALHGADRLRLYRCSM